MANCMSVLHDLEQHPTSLFSSLLNGCRAQRGVIISCPTCLPRVYFIANDEAVALDLCEIKKNASSSGLDEDIRIKFYGIMHWILAYTTAYTVDHGLYGSANRKLLPVTSSNERLKHKCVDLSYYNRYLNQIWYRSQISHCLHAGMVKFTTSKYKMPAAAILDFYVM